MQNVFTAHKQIEQILRYLATIAEQAREGIVVVDIDSSVRFVNEAWAQMHGYKTKDELLGKQLSIFHTTEQMKSDVVPLFEKTKCCGQIEGTAEHIRSDGTVFPTQTKMILVEDDADNANGLIIFAANIEQHTILHEATVENLKRIKHLGERITQFQKLLGECLKAGECLTEQTGEFQANNEILLQYMGKLDRSTQSPKIQNHESHKSEVSAENSEPIERPKRTTKLPNTKDLEMAAELASRLSVSPDHNLQSKHKDNQEEIESRINQAISAEWMQAVQKYAD